MFLLCSRELAFSSIAGAVVGVGGGGGVVGWWFQVQGMKLFGLVSEREERRGEERRGDGGAYLVLSCLVGSWPWTIEMEGEWGMVKDGRCRRNKDPGQIYPCKAAKRSKYLIYIYIV